MIPSLVMFTRSPLRSTAPSFRFLFFSSLVALNYSTLLIGVLLVMPIIVSHAFVSSETFAFWGEMLVGSVCTVAILTVVFYHMTATPHPKFTMNPRRKLCLRVHVMAGTIEILVSLAAIAMKGVWQLDVTLLGQIQVHICRQLYVFTYLLF